VTIPDQTNESDPLLDDTQPRYGSPDSRDNGLPDEDEIRREREALEQITAEAAEYVLLTLGKSFGLNTKLQ
jgi:hypothetical protein